MLLLPPLQVTGRTKSLYSTLKKLLRLGDTERGGRARSDVYDLLGLRCVVQPRRGLAPAEAEALATQVSGRCVAWWAAGQTRRAAWGALWAAPMPGAGGCSDSWLQRTASSLCFCCWR